MKELFQIILSDYQAAYKSDYSSHPLANLIRYELPEIIKKIIFDNERYLIKGSAGNGRWTFTPWLAVFDILITDTAQSGYYPVYLFKDDMSGFYLSLNQGVTEIKKKYKRDTMQVLKLKAEDFRAQLGKIPGKFDQINISLTNQKKGNSKLYEAGNVLAKYYSASKLPTNEELQTDLLEILKIYELLSYNEALPMSSAEKENDEDKFLGFEDLRKFRFHKRIERNAQLSKKVKNAQGYICKACNFNFENMYGSLIKNFIEAHHLIPFSKLTVGRIQLDVRLDFVVLCSNCHSMIHRLEDPSNIDLLINEIRHNKI